MLKAGLTDENEKNKIFRLIFHVVLHLKENSSQNMKHISV